MASAVNIISQYIDRSFRRAKARILVNAFFAALALFSSGLAVADPNLESCIEKVIKDQKISSSDLKQFLKIQSDITLHRLARTFLKNSVGSEAGQFDEIENKILKLVGERNSDSSSLSTLNRLKASKGRRQFLSEAFKAFPNVFAETTIQPDGNAAPLELHGEDFIDRKSVV